MQTIGDQKSNYNIIKNLTSHKECKPDSAQDNLQKDLDTMTAKYEALKTQHESEFK